MEEMFKQLSLTPEMLEQRKDAQAELNFISEKENDYEISKAERRKQDPIELYTRIDLSKPHIANLNQDPQLSRKVTYSIEEDSTKIGKRGAEDKNDIEIGGMGIRKLQAVIKSIEGSFFL